MSVVAVIPARGGSKGVRDKNLRAVGGVPLVSRAVMAARRSSVVDRVLVSTDDERIAIEARHAGGEIVERPLELAGDEASSESALLHALEQVPAAQVLAFVQCTSPFTRPSDIDRVVTPVLRGEAHVAFSACRFHGFVWRSDGDGSVRGVNHDPTVRERRQDRPRELLETGAVYALEVPGFRAGGHRFFGRTVAIELDPARALEIDTAADLRVAESLCTILDAQSLREQLNWPKLVALDFDGVFTDNRVLVDEHGREAVLCHRGDGHGLAELQKYVRLVVLSTETNAVVKARCDKLGLPCEHGLGNSKLAALRRHAETLGVDLTDVLFVGNDVNDLQCMRSVGTPVAVADAVPEVRAAARIVLTRNGGAGALRELSDALISKHITREV